MMQVEPSRHPEGGKCYSVLTNAADANGTASPWIPVHLTAGIDLVVTSGTARVEVTACAPDRQATALATVWPGGTVSAGNSYSDRVLGASYVRLVMVTQGNATMSVRT